MLRIVEVTEKLFLRSWPSKTPFFSASFLRSILKRFLVDFRRFWEAKIAPKSRFFAFVGGSFSRLSFSSISDRFFFNFLAPETLKMKLSPRRELNFYKIVVFVFDVKMHQKIDENFIGLGVKIQRKSLKMRFEKRGVFDFVFGAVLEWFWRDFWRVWGGLGREIKGK